MSDIVERLHSAMATDEIDPARADALFAEAADEIERLQTVRNAMVAERVAEVERLKAVLRPLAAIQLWRDVYPDGPDIITNEMLKAYFTVNDIRTARAALEGKP